MAVSRHFSQRFFRREDASFTYNGDTTLEGRAVSEFGFKVPYEKSHYYYGEGPQRVISAYDGTFFVDPKTANLVQLSVRTSQLPKETAACYASTKLDYTQLHLNDADFLLPRVSVLSILHVDGSESENRSVFSNCHEFRGESTLSFDPPPKEEHPKTGSAAPGPAIPKGLPFRVAITQEIDSATAAAGDMVTAKLISSIQDGSRVLVPAGSAVTARIVRIREFYKSPSHVALEIKLESVMIGGISMRLNARPDIAAKFEKKKDGTLLRRVELGTLRGLEDRSGAFVFRNIALPYIVGTGLESMWLTADPR